jgi:hypothetical protein
MKRAKPKRENKKNYETTRIFLGMHAPDMSSKRIL